uniref:EAP30/Vps36 family protein n=1 Tax=Spironucleus salmonicida TaxID=348837 RepID=V6LSA2_9EUKA|eukprot:EST47138.1 EAP30/Vps36 family protein [Spironucleus salmonicida]
MDIKRFRPLNFSTHAESDRHAPYLLSDERVFQDAALSFEECQARAFLTQTSLHLQVEGAFFCFNLHDVTNVQRTPAGITLYFGPKRYALHGFATPAALAEFFNATMQQASARKFISALPVQQREQALTNALQFAISTSSNTFAQLQQNAASLLELIAKIRRVIAQNRFQDDALKGEVALIDQELDLQIQSPARDLPRLRDELDGVLGRMQARGIMPLDRVYGRWNKARSGNLIAPDAMVRVCEGLDGWAVKVLNGRKYLLDRSFAADINERIRGRTCELHGFRFLRQGDFTGFEVDWLEEMCQRGKFLCYDGAEQRQYFFNAVQ